MGTHFQQLIDDSGTIWNLLFQIFCILLPAIFVLGKAVHFLWKGGTPKYYFWKPLRIILYVHLFLGATEYVLFFTRFFVSSTTLSYVLASVNILHSISIVGMCIGVSGERYWMIPTYFWVIVIKLYYSGALFASPDSFTIFMAMFYLHSFFAWGRLFFIVMSATYLFESCAYSMSSNLGVVVSLSQALGQSNDYQFITIFFLLIMGTAIIFQITKPRFIVDNDQTNDSLFNMFTAEQIDTVIGEFKKIDDQSGSTGSTANHVESAGSQSETTMANMMDVLSALLSITFYARNHMKVLYVDFTILRFPQNLEQIYQMRFDVFENSGSDIQIEINK